MISLEILEYVDCKNILCLKDSFVSQQNVMPMNICIKETRLASHNSNIRKHVFQDSEGCKRFSHGGVFNDYRRLVFWVGLIIPHWRRQKMLNLSHRSVKMDYSNVVGLIKHSSFRNYGKMLANVYLTYSYIYNVILNSFAGEFSSFKCEE